jgi:hypothetical protein
MQICGARAASFSDPDMQCWPDPDPHQDLFPHGLHLFLGITLFFLMEWVHYNGI